MHVHPSLQDAARHKPNAPMRSVAMDVFAMPEVTVEGETYHCVMLAVDRQSR